MTSHQMAMAASVCTTEDDGAVGSVANRTQTAFENNPPAASQTGFVPTDVSVRMHTLILTGGLDRRSAHALEMEIERLCEEGVTGITLDLRQLTYIDSIGVAVIAFRCRLCRRRGYEFALIPGSPQINRAFEQAGGRELLPFQEDHVAASRPPTPTRGRRLSSVAAQ